MNMLSLMYVAFGGAVGAMARYLMTEAVAKLNATSFPFGTLSVNVLGGFLMGLWVAVFALWLDGKPKDLHLLVAIGALGGFTTFSAFSMDLFLLLERGLLTQAMLYIVGSVVLSVTALLAGMWIVKLAAG